MTPCPSDLRALARALGGDVVGRQVLAPGPGHSPKDRSLSIALSATAPEGFLAFSHAGDDFTACRDHVKWALRIKSKRDIDARRSAECRRRPSEPRLNSESRDHALALWGASVDPRGTLAERYLNGRGLELDDDLAGAVLRWHPGISAMLALFRNIETDKPQSISRTFLDGDARKLGRKFLGPVGGGAIKLDADDAVLGGLHIGEGVETAMAARALGLRPTWALGSKGAIGAFPVLPAVDALTILAEPDAGREIEACAARWHSPGREVFINRSLVGKDLADYFKEGEIYFKGGAT